MKSNREASPDDKRTPEEIIADLTRRAREKIASDKAKNETKT